MSEDRKKPTAGFWITVAMIAVLVGYPLGFGPACWATSQMEFERGARVVSAVFRPLIERSPRAMRYVLERYAEFGAPTGWMWDSFERRWVRGWVE